jgi:hypothetical protein
MFARDTGSAGSTSNALDSFVGPAQKSPLINPCSPGETEPAGIELMN